LGGGLGATSLFLQNKSLSMKKYYTILLTIFSISGIYDQSNYTAIKYTDPYSSYDQFNNYNPKSIDFSKEFYKQSVWVLLNEEKA